MAETVVVPLDMPIPSSPPVVFDHVEWWNPSSRFAVVKYAVAGEAMEFGLRLDLDKQSFLDALETDLPDGDAVIADIARRICVLVSEKRNDMQIDRPEVAGARSGAPRAGSGTLLTW